MFTNLFDLWQFYLIFSLIFSVLFFQAYKLAVQNAKNDAAATILLQIIAGLSMIPLIPLFQFKWPQNPINYLLFCAAIVFFTISDRAQTTARKHLDVSLVTILLQLGTVFLVTFGIIFYKEPASIPKILGALLIVAANILVIYEGKKSTKLKRQNLWGQITSTIKNIDPYVFTALIAVVCFSIGITIDIGNSEQFNLPFYIMLSLIVPAVLLAIFDDVNFEQIKHEYNISNKKWYLITGISWGLLIITNLRSLQLGEITTVIPLQSLNVILNVIFAYIILHERKDLFKKIFAALIIAVGIYLTVLV